VFARRIASCVSIALLAAGLGGCASVIDNHPVNLAISSPERDQSLRADPAFEDVVVGLAFSGGGTRAAAFAHGVLTEMDSQETRGAHGQRTLADAVDFVSGVSGGSVAAAYFALKGRAAIADFRERFLLRNAEEDLKTSVTLANLATAWQRGGLNDVSGLPRWLDANLFGEATFGDVVRRGRPLLVINASDIYNGIPFVFTHESFNALCSSLDAYPLADAVAASAAVPIAFTPVVLQAYPDSCRYVPPPWLQRALVDPSTSLNLRAYAQSLQRYRDSAAMRYVKLLDGGLTDNFGLHGLIVARAAASAPYAPMTPDRAVRMRHLLIIVVDAGRSSQDNWALTPEGPSGAQLLSAVTDTAIVSNVRNSYDTARLLMQDWQRELVAWRCRLGPAEVTRLRGTLAGWDCRDVKFEIDRVDFSAAGPDYAPRLNQVPTRFKLAAEQVDLVIEAGRRALRASPVYRRFVGHFHAKPAAAVAAAQ
jgi:NTE family protein